MLETWDGYKNWVGKFAKDGLYYRGHANENWKLQTSFHREASRAIRLGSLFT
jgi:hypothetical protein